MSKDEIKNLLEFLRRKWRDGRCPMCRSANFNVEEDTYQLMRYGGGSVVIGGPVVPVVPVICTNCGNTVLVNAIIAGVIPADATKTEGKEGQ